MVRKQSESKTEKLLASLVRSVPWIEPTPFFAYRVSHLAYRSRSPLAFSVQSLARRLVPLFLSIALVALLVSFQLTQPQATDTLLDAELLVEQEYSAEPITIATVLDSLGGDGDEEASFERSR